MAVFAANDPLVHCQAAQFEAACRLRERIRPVPAMRTHSQDPTLQTMPPEKTLGMRRCRVGVDQGPQAGNRRADQRIKGIARAVLGGNLGIAYRVDHEEDGAGT